MLKTNEIYSLIAISSLSVVYFIRDIYIFNRAPSRNRFLTKVQCKVILLYPLWTFLEWTGSIQTARREITGLFFTTLAKHSVGFFTTVCILNDSFRITMQQFGGYFISLLITFIWAAFWLFVMDE